MRPLRWTVHDGSSGATPAEVEGPVTAFFDMLARVEANGVGYVEVSREGRDFPMIALSIAAGHGAVHLLVSETSSMLLRGDGSVSSTTEVELPVIAEPAIFTGAFVRTATSACDVAREFAGGTAAIELGEWSPL